MKKILAFGASSSRNSINKKLATYAASQIENVDVTILDLNDFEMPLFSVDKEKNGMPEQANIFKNHLREADGIIISFAEHNGSYAAVYKNLVDWTSRIKSENKIWEGKHMFLMASSPGGRGGKTVLGAALGSYNHQGGNIVANFSLPRFNDNFSVEEGITDSELAASFKEQLNLFVQKI
mgnify:CR=1 FL=1